MNEEIKLFLNCDLNEADYFSLSKDNLLTLKDYLLQFKDKDNDFTSSIQSQFESIKEKCSWVTSISFGGYIHKDGIYGITSIYLNSEDGIDLVAEYNKKTNRYEGLIKEDKVPQIYLISRKIRKLLLRQKDINIIQDELREIERIGRDIYIDVLFPINSASENFQICYVPHTGLYVYDHHVLIAKYLMCKPKHVEKEFLRDNVKKEKLLRKILINPNNQG